VAENKNAANEMIEKSGQMGVPVIAVNGEIVVGFNQARLDSLLS
jgi:glutaredoxin